MLRRIYRRLTRRRRRLDRVRFDTTLGPELFLRGALRGNRSVLVQGQVEGQANLGGSFMLAESGYWQGDIRATHVIIAGEVHGNVSAREHLELAASARIHGHLKSPVIAIAEGALHEGEVRTPRRTRMIRFDERRQDKNNSQD
jgi:cytoskeletal protein CcmA (bactofilin family)